MINHKKYFKIAIMGCVVNGPGEADIGLVGGENGLGFFLKKGKVFKTVQEKDFLKFLLQEIKLLISTRKILRKEKP